MATEDSGTKLVPPYVSYRTFRNFMEDLRQGVPGRIDRSVMPTLSGTVQGHLLAALRYFDLIEDDGTTRDALHRLVDSEGEEWKRQLTLLLQEGYPWIFDSPSFNLSNATSMQFIEKFRASGASGDTVRKCASFFLAAARDAELAVSPRIRITQATRQRNDQAQQAKGRKREASPKPDVMVSTDTPTASVVSTDNGPSWAEMLLAKFPTFDPDWPDEVKIKWFDAFDRLMNSGSDHYATQPKEEEVDP